MANIIYEITYREGEHLITTLCSAEYALSLRESGIYLISVKARMI